MKEIMSSRKSNVYLRSGPKKVRNKSKSKANDEGSSISPPKNVKKRKVKVCDQLRSKKAKIESNQIADPETCPPENHQLDRNREEPIGIMSDSFDSPEKSNGENNNVIPSTSVLSDEPKDSQFENGSKQSTVGSIIRRGVMIIGADDSGGELVFFVKELSTGDVNKVKYDEAKNKWPEELFEYFRSNLKWF